MKDDDFRVLTAMTKYGGSFVEHLGLAALAASEYNYERLKFAFKDIWDKYEELAAIKQHNKLD